MIKVVNADQLLPEDHRGVLKPEDRVHVILDES